MNVLRLVTGGSGRLRHHVLFLDASGPAGEELAREGVSVTYAPTGNLIGSIRASLALYHLLRETHFDIVMLYGLRANKIGRIVGRFAQTGTIVGGLRSTYPSGRKANWTLWLDRLTFRWTAGYISNSQAAIDHLVSHGYPPSKFWLVRQGVDVTRFRPAAAEDKARLRQELGVPQDLPVISCVANLRPVKDHETLLRALAQVQRGGLRFRAEFAGEGPLRPHLEALAAKLDLADSVRFRGRVPSNEIPDLLRISDIAVLSSRVEGLPTALIEAMACGVPVAATRVGGTPEVVMESSTGFLVEPKDSTALAAVIARLLEEEELRERMAVAARARAEELFSLDAMVKRYEAVLLRLAAPGST